MFVAGSDGVHAQPISTDSSGRIILGAPSANIPVSIAAQSLSPIVTQDATDQTIGVVASTTVLAVGGQNVLGKIQPLPVNTPGASGSGQFVNVGGVDTAGINRPLPLEIPANAYNTSRVAVSGSDGTNARAFLLDTSGRVILGAPSANLPVSIAAQSLSPIVVSGAVTTVADSTLGLAIPAKAFLVAGSDATNARAILTDASGRIVLGAPSANLPVSIAAQSLSPIVVSGSVTQGTSPWVTSEAPANSPAATIYNNMGLPQAAGLTVWAGPTTGTTVYLDSLTIDILVTTAPSSSTAISLQDVLGNTLWQSYIAITTVGHWSVCITFPHKYKIAAGASGCLRLVLAAASTGSVGAISFVAAYTTAP